MRADLAERVRQAIATLGYRHDAAASALRRADGLSASIDLIVVDVANPFFSCVQRAVEAVALAPRLVARGSGEIVARAAAA